MVKKPWLVTDTDNPRVAKILAQYDTLEDALHSHIGGYIMARDTYSEARNKPMPKSDWKLWQIIEQDVTDQTHNLRTDLRMRKMVERFAREVRKAHDA